MNDRLLRLQEENQRTADMMREIRPRFDRIAGADPTPAISGFNLFQTPVDIAQRMAGTAGVEFSGARILEPSAGLGRLVNAIQGQPQIIGEMVLVENNTACIELLQNNYRDASIDVIAQDFLDTTIEQLGLFDIILMNPPFQRGRDIKHIEHATTMLAHGGHLVALCYNGAMQNRNLKPYCDSWTVLPEGSFKSEGTTASVALLTRSKKR